MYAWYCVCVCVCERERERERERESDDVATEPGHPMSFPLFAGGLA